MTKDVKVALTFDYDAYSVWIGSNSAASPSMISRGEFCAEAVMRILPLLKRYDIKATFFTPGHTALAFPKTVVAIADAGHELGHHGWVHENPVAATPEQEREYLDKGFKALKRVADVRPVGYRSPAWDNSPSTIELLLENGFRYESSMMASEYEPYWCRVGDRWSKTEPWSFGNPVDLVEIPVNWMMDDFPYFEIVWGGNQGNQTPRQVLQMWIDEFDYLYDRVGKGIYTLTMHPQVIGRGSRLLILEMLIEHMKSREGVTFCTLADYADDWRVGKTPSLPALAEGWHAEI